MKRSSSDCANFSGEYNQNIAERQACVVSSPRPPRVAVCNASSRINRQPTSFQRRLHGNERQPRSQLAKSRDLPFPDRTTETTLPTPSSDNRDCLTHTHTHSHTDTSLPASSSFFTYMESDCFYQTV